MRLKLIRKEDTFGFYLILDQFYCLRCVLAGRKLLIRLERVRIDWLKVGRRFELVEEKRLIRQLLDGLKFHFWGENLVLGLLIRGCWLNRGSREVLLVGGFDSDLRGFRGLEGLKFLSWAWIGLRWISWFHWAVLLFPYYQ